MSDRPAPINEIVGFLDRYAPRSLEDLRRKYPREEENKLLKPGIEAGRTSEQLQLRAEASVVGLRKAMQVCESSIPQVRKKLARAQRVQLVSQIATAVSGASVFTALQFDAPKTAMYIAAGFALVGTIMALGGQHLGTTLDPGRSLFGKYVELVECQIEAQGICQEIEPWIISGFKGISRVESIVRANVLCARLLRVQGAV